MDETWAENLERKKLKEMECTVIIDAILPSLLEQNLVTDMECRVIAGCSRLMEKQAAIHNIIMSKTKEEAATLTEIFRSLAYPDELTKTNKTSDCKDEQEIHLQQDKPNPLLNDTVLSCLFGYLSLHDIKHSRLVCFKWNSAAEIYLRKRCTIHFRPDGLTPQTFMEISKYSLPDRPFSAYKFSGVDYAWCEDHIENFFDKWGKNVKELEIVPWRGCNHRIYDVTRWIAKTPNLCSLKIGNAKHDKSTLFSIAIDKLATIKTVFLGKCRIHTNCERVTFLPGSNVSLIDVSFQRQGNIEVLLNNFCYNEFFDFRQAVNVAIISNEYQNGIKFDMAGQINKNELYLQFVTLENWTRAKGDVNLLRLSGCNFNERNGLKLTRLIIDNSEVNLTVLPPTLEKISFGEEINIFSSEPFELPNLKYLGLEAESDNSRILAHFANCPNLTDVELWSNDGFDSDQTLHMDCIPRNVKKLKISDPVTFMFDFANGDQMLELDTLLLENIKAFSDCKTILERIKQKVLVISYRKETLPLHESDIVQLILDNKQIGTIVVGIVQEVQDNIDLHEKIPFEGSLFSSYVDKKSNCYKFENEVGHAIELKEYEDFNAIDGMGHGFFSKLTFELGVL